MNSNSRTSILLSRICILLFAVCLLGCDIFGVPLVRIFAEYRGLDKTSLIALTVCLYALSVPAWVLLGSLWKLLGNLNRSEVFTQDNIALLKVIVFCCAAAVILCIAGCFFYLPLIIIAIAAAFMMLIVQIVKNVFRQALDMKSELDLTI